MNNPLRQGDICFVDFGEPRGSAPAFRRPAVIVQSDQINRSRIQTVICIPLTSNLLLARAPGNLLLRRSETGLDRDSVAVVSQITNVDRSVIGEWVGAIDKHRVAAILGGLDLLLAR